MTRPPSEREKFIWYVWEFYGAGGIYPIGATVKMIRHATRILQKTQKNVAFDSFDRERVRDIMIKQLGLKWEYDINGNA